MSPLPFRFSEKSVYRYLSILTSIQNTANPKRIVFDPSTIGVSAETAACRLRDAVRSFASGMTQHPTIDSKLLVERFRHYRVKHDGNTVMVVPKTEKNTTGDSLAPLLVGQDDSCLAVLEASNTDAIAALALLLGQHVLQGVVEITGTLNSEFAKSLLDKYDVALLPVNETLTKMF